MEKVNEKPKKPKKPSMMFLKSLQKLFCFILTCFYINKIAKNIGIYYFAHLKYQKKKKKNYQYKSMWRAIYTNMV